MMNVNMEGLDNSSEEDMTNDMEEELNLAMVSDTNFEDLMADVSEVQKILECNNVGQKIDVNEIYEKLEELAYVVREKRIEYVATQLLHKSGIIVENDVAPEERAFKFKDHLPNNEVPVTSFTYTLSETGDVTSQNNVCAISKISDMCAPYDVAPDFPKLRQDVVSISRPATSPGIAYHQKESNAKVLGACSQDFYVDTETLMEEAKLIYSILPDSDIEQIYACLIVNKDSDVRVDIVTEIFFQMSENKRRISKSEIVNSRNMDNKLVEEDISSSKSVFLSHNAISSEKTYRQNQNPPDKIYTSSSTIHSPKIQHAFLQKSSPLSCVSYYEDIHKSNREKECEQVQSSYNGTKDTKDCDTAAQNCFGSTNKRQNLGSDSTQTSDYPKRSSTLPEFSDMKETDKCQSKVSVLTTQEDFTNSESTELEAGAILGTSELHEIDFREDSVPVPSNCSSNCDYFPLSTSKFMEENACESDVSNNMKDITMPSVTNQHGKTDLLDLEVPNSESHYLKERFASSTTEAVETPADMNEQVENNACITSDETFSDLSELPVHNSESCSSVDMIWHNTNSSVDEMESSSLLRNNAKDLHISEDTSSTASLVQQAESFHSVETCNDLLIDYRPENDNLHLCEGSETGDHLVCKAVVRGCTDSRLVQEQEISNSIQEDLIDLDFMFVEMTDIEEQKKSVEGTGDGNVANFQNVTSEPYSNMTQEHENIGDTQNENEKLSIINTEDDCNHFNFTSDNFEEECSHRKLEELHEIFPDVGMDYLTDVSLKFDSLSDMVNNVLEQTDDDQDDTSVLQPTSSSVTNQSSQGCRKKEITYEEYLASLPNVDPVFLEETWKRIGTNYSAVKEFISQQLQETSEDNQYHTLLSLFPHASPAFLREKCNEIGDDENALGTFIEEQLQSDKNEAQFHSLLVMFPQTDADYLRKRCTEIGNDEAAMRAFVVEQLKVNEGDDKYHTLLAMFPDADPAVLRRTVDNIGNDEEAMRRFVGEQIEEMESVKFQTLLAILPDADPEYLQEQFERIGNDEESIKLFITEVLEHKTYPTRDAYIKRQEVAAMKRKYKEEFNIYDFLEMFPDPRKHFTDGKKNTTVNEIVKKHGIAYLEYKYRDISLDQLTCVFKKNKYNLTLTCWELDKWQGPQQSLREIFEHKVPDEEDIPVAFLQEVAFIENEQRIKDLLQGKEQQKRDAFELAKANGELLECQCCYDSEVMAEDIVSCPEGHVFCKECVRRSADVIIGNGQNSFLCLTNCIAEFSLKVMRMVLKPTVFARIVQRKQMEEIQAAGIEEVENCPFCNFPNIPFSDDKVLMCTNPDCARDSCRKCRRSSHIPLRCDEVESKEVKMRTYIEDRMTDALIRTCCRCKKSFIKESGCNKMTCSCGAMMCYICRQPVQDYTHFNGQGGTEFHKCPLYSDLEVIHDVAVQEEGIKAKKEIQTQNPNIELKHDPTEIKPIAKK